MTTFVYTYKTTEDDGLELRYSLRGLSQFWVGPDPDVWVVGDCPEWVQGVRHVPVESTEHKSHNRLQKMLAVTRALGEVGITEFVALDDDCILLDYTDEIVFTYRATWLDHWRVLRVHPDAQWFVDSGRVTDRIFRERGISEQAFSFDHHRPIPLKIEDVLRALEPFEQGDPAEAPLWRTLAGNEACVHNLPFASRDIRADAHIPAGTKWVSTDERYFARSARVLDQLLPTPSRWEALL